MEKVGAEADNCTPKVAKRVFGYLINNLQARGKPARKTLLGYAAAWGAFAVILWGIDISSIIPTYPAKATLAIIVWACIVWITEAIPVGISGLMIPMLLVVTKAVPKIPEAFGGYVMDVSFLCLGAFIFGAILWSANLDTRIALTVLSKIKSTKVGKIILGLSCTCMGLALVIPAAVARSAT